MYNIVTINGLQGRSQPIGPTNCIAYAPRSPRSSPNRPIVWAYIVLLYHNLAMAGLNSGIKMNLCIKSPVNLQKASTLQVDNSQ